MTTQLSESQAIVIEYLRDPSNGENFVPFSIGRYKWSASIFNGLEKRGLIEVKPRMIGTEQGRTLWCRLLKA